ncbi:hypothetical protein ACFS5O_18795 [Fictibacillus nanhaiensis]
MPSLKSLAEWGKEMQVKVKDHV